MNRFSCKRNRSMRSSINNLFLFIVFQNMQSLFKPHSYSHGLRSKSHFLFDRENYQLITSSILYKNESETYRSACQIGKDSLSILYAIKIYIKTRRINSLLLHSTNDRTSNPSCLTAVRQFKHR